MSGKTKESMKSVDEKNDSYQCHLWDALSGSRGDVGLVLVLVQIFPVAKNRGFEHCNPFTVDALKFVDFGSILPLE